MARVQLVMPDEDRDRFTHQAKLEGMSLSAWLRSAARERLESRQATKKFQSPQEVREFFRTCAGNEGPEPEPDWNEHLQTMTRSRAQGASGT